MDDRRQRFVNQIGQAALELWPNLPRDVQELLFERVIAGDQTLREPLAIYLHDHHPRTAHPPRPAALA